MPAPFSRGLSAFAPIMNRQGMASPQRAMPNIMPASTGSLRNMPRPQPLISMPRPGPTPPPAMVQPQRMAPPVMAAPNPFAGYTQPVTQQPLGFNQNPTPTAGQGAGQMPMMKPQMLPQVQPFDQTQFAQPQMLPQVQPFDYNQFAQPRSKFDEQMFAQPDVMTPSLFSPGAFRMK